MKRIIGGQGGGAAVKTEQTQTLFKRCKGEFRLHLIVFCLSSFLLVWMFNATNATWSNFHRINTKTEEFNIFTHFNFVSLPRFTILGNLLSKLCCVKPFVIFKGRYIQSEKKTRLKRAWKQKKMGGMAVKCIRLGLCDSVGRTLDR